MNKQIYLLVLINGIFDKENANNSDSGHGQDN